MHQVEDIEEILVFEGRTLLVKDEGVGENLVHLDGRLPIGEESNAIDGDPIGRRGSCGRFLKRELWS